MFFTKKKKLNKPIFLVGSSKSGTTILGLLFQIHPEIGPNNKYSKNYSNFQDFISAILDDNTFNDVANEMEQKALWDSYFEMPTDLKLRQGVEIKLTSNPLTNKQTNVLINRLTKNFKEDRFFSKQPFNTFRVHVLREIFPDAKIIAIHRDGRDVVSSWLRKGNRLEQFNGYENAINYMSQKWNEAIEHIELYKEDLNIHTIKYEELIENPQITLNELFSYCELNLYPEKYDKIELRNATGLWKSRIPEEFHELLNKRVVKSLEMLGYLN